MIQYKNVFCVISFQVPFRMLFLILCVYPVNNAARCDTVSGPNTIEMKKQFILKIPIVPLPESKSFDLFRIKRFIKANKKSINIRFCSENVQACPALAYIQFFCRTISNCHSINSRRLPVICCFMRPQNVYPFYCHSLPSFQIVDVNFLQLLQAESLIAPYMDSINCIMG